MNDVSLSTERLILREFNEGDISAIHEYASDPLVTQYMEWGPNTMEDTNAFVKRVLAYQSAKPRTHYELAVILKETGQLIGACGIRPQNITHRSADMGYTLGRPHWGKGYATELATALRDFGFNTLKLHRIWATCRPENMASAHVLKKIGMIQEGYLRDEKLCRGKWIDTLLFAVLNKVDS